MSSKNFFRCFSALVFGFGVLTCRAAETCLPAPDEVRIAADEARGIRFSADRRTLVKYPAEFTDAEYTVPAGVTAIGEGAFDKNIHLKQVNIPEGVTAIGANAFYWCIGLTELRLPASVKNIGESAFVGCGRIEVDPENPRYFTDGSGALIDRESKILLFFPPGFRGSYSIPFEVTAIGEEAFQCCMELTEVVIPPSVTAIGDGAFSGCRKLTRAAIPIGVKSIGEEAFQDCVNLTDVMLPPTVTTIGKHAFKDCQALKLMTIPVSVKSIGEGAFSGCPCEAAVRSKFPSYK